MNKMIAALLSAVLFACLSGCGPIGSAAGNVQAPQAAPGISIEVEEVVNTSEYNQRTLISEVIGDPAFGEFGRLIFPTFYFGDYIDNGDPAIQATGMWQMMRQACYDFAESYTAAGGNCTVVDLPKEGINGNDHFMFQDLNNDVIADHVENWIGQNVK